MDVLDYQVPDVKEQEVVRASRRQDDHRYITDRGHSLVISTSTSVYSVISANEVHILAPGKPVVNSTFLRNLATNNDAPEDQFSRNIAVNKVKPYLVESFAYFYARKANVA